MRRPRGRPPWWPEGEPFPPRGGPPWRRHGRRFLLFRLGCLAGLLLLVLYSVTAMLVLAGQLGLIAVKAGPGWVILLGIPFVLVLALAIFALRGVRAPVGQLVDAAGQIEAGDYSARIAEGGPRELRSVARAFNSMSARLEATDAQRRSFVADVTHELRTPLAIIRGQAEAIADGVYAGDAEHVAPILDATESLERLVADLATLTLSETGSLSLAREPVDLAVLVNETLAAFSSEAQAKGVRLSEQVSAEVPLVDVDPARIRGVLANLLANALRHTPAEGSIRVSAQPSGETVTLTVTDDGDGIPPDLLPRVFDRFTRGPGSTGSGLGLAIARDVVQAHGGTIDVTSEVGKGTAARVVLPAWKTNAASGVVEAAPG